MALSLHQEVTNFFTIVEGQGPVPVIMTLDEIIKAGKVTNPYQTFVLGWLSEFFKNGLKSASLQLENPIDFESNATHTDVVMGLKSLSPEAQVQLAQYLKDCVIAGESLVKVHNLDIIEWMRYVLQAQR